MQSSEDSEMLVWLKTNKKKLKMAFLQSTTNYQKKTFM